MTSNNTEIEEIISLKSVDIYQLCYNTNHSEYDVISIIKDQNFRIFREIFVESNKQKDLSQRLALIKCKDWFYPLEAGKTFVYRSGDRNGGRPLSYLFPDPENPNSLSVVVINTEVVDELKIILFENVLLLYATLGDSPQEWSAIIAQLTAIASQPSTPEVVPERVPEVESPETPLSEPQSGMAQTLANHIVYGAEVINNGITFGTQMANNLIMKGSRHLKAHQSSQTPHNVNVDPRVISGLKALRTTSHAACAVTGYAVSTVAKGTNELSKCLAPHVRRHSTKLISNVSGKNATDSGKICNDIITVASGGLQGFATLYNGVTENAKILAKTVTNETVDIVNRKYGTDAGRATEEALYTAGNAAITVQNVQHLGPKAIAKKAAIDTGKTVITNNNNNHNKDDTNPQK